MSDSSQGKNKSNLHGYIIFLHRSSQLRATGLVMTLFQDAQAIIGGNITPLVMEP
jgi:hypothetical protein